MYISFPDIFLYMKIGVDIDEVLGELLRLFIELHNTENSTRIRVEDILDYSIAKLFGCTQQEIDRKIERFFKSGYGNKILPVDGAAEAIQNLARDHELIVISARPTWFKQQTVHWLDTHFPGAFSEFHFVDEISMEADASAKAEMCRRLNIDVMVEDSHKNAHACSTFVDKVFLLDRPWNRTDVLGNVLRVSAWDEVVQGIKLMENKPRKMERIDEELCQDVFTFSSTELCSYLP